MGRQAKTLRQSFSKSTSSEKVTVLECFQNYYLCPYHWVTSLLSSYPKANLYSCDHQHRLHSVVATPRGRLGFVFSCNSIEFTHESSAIFSEHTAFQRSRSHRETLYHITCVLTQCDSFSEKLTFIQNSLLLLYIDKKNEN